MKIILTAIGCVPPPPISDIKERKPFLIAAKNFLDFLGALGLFC